MVAAGALVTPGKGVRKGELWAGTPARPMRPLSPADIAEFAASVRRYVSLGRQYLAERRDQLDNGGHPRPLRRRAAS
jgi:carbonic anhydrase/acetyltransferase-like protein (isoleucine patch superfamily)